MGLELEGVIAERGQEKEGPKEKESWGHAGGAGVQPSSRAPDGKNLFSCRCLLAADKVDWTEGLGCRCSQAQRHIHTSKSLSVRAFPVPVCLHGLPFLSLPLVTSHLGMSKCKMQKSR